MTDKELLDHYDKRTPGLKVLHSNNYDILERVMKFFIKHDIVALPWGGTAIGAYRHKAIIPWDDDLDMIVRRDDIIKLEKIKDQLLELNLKLTPPSSKAGKWTNWKIHDTTGNMPGFVDLVMVFQTKPKKRYYIWSWLAMLSIARFHTPFKSKFLSELVGYIANPLALILPRKLILKAAIKSADKNFDVKETWMSPLTWFHIKKSDKWNLHPDAFKDAKLVPFGTTQMFTSKHVEDYIKVAIPKYMEMPPEKIRVTKHMNEWQKYMKGVK